MRHFYQFQTKVETKSYRLYSLTRRATAHHVIDGGASMEHVHYSLGSRLAGTSAELGKSLIKSES